jgi:16S rRNA (adenine1518-N6/adenine1519-N6)-dimethyltransferase
MNHRPKKSLGQNFLKSKMILNLMCQTAFLKKDDTVLEIGPGKGSLTEKILAEGVKTIAVEKDDGLFVFLKEKFEKEIKNGQLTLEHQDILDFKTDQIKNNYKIIANIPYYITGLIIKKFLSEKKQPEAMVLLVQKEVADRIVAKDSKESILSLSVKVYGEVKYIKKVSKKLFSPSPKVDSAIIHISNISKKNFPNKEIENRFFDVIKAGFLHKRKLLIRNLENIAPKEELQKVFSDLKIDSKIRPEDVSLEKWLLLSKKLFKY